MATQQVFSKEQKNSIHTIVHKVIEKELVPVNERLDRHEKRLDTLTMKIVEHGERLSNIETKLDDLPTKSWIQELFDKYLARFDEMNTELRALSRTSMRHEDDIAILKRVAERNTKSIGKLEVQVRSN